MSILLIQEVPYAWLVDRLKTKMQEKRQRLILKIVSLNLNKSHGYLYCIPLFFKFDSPVTTTCSVMSIKKWLAGKEI